MKTKPEMSPEMTSLCGDHLLLERLSTDYVGGATLADLSGRYKLSVPIIRQLLVAAAVTIRQKGSSHSSLQHERRSETMAKLYNEGQTLQEIGDEFNLSRERVRQILRSAGVKSLGRRAKPIDAQPLTDEEQKIVADYDRGISPAALRKQYKGLTYQDLQAILKRAGIEPKPKGFFSRRENYDEIVDGVVRDYKAGEDTGVIADRYGLCARTEIYKFLNREGVPVRIAKKRKN